MLRTEHKGFKIVPDGTFGNKVITREGKGAMPKVLGGSFTNHKQASNAIDAYLDSKGTKNGEGNDNT